MYIVLYRFTPNVYNYVEKHQKRTDIWGHSCTTQIEKMLNVTRMPSLTQSNSNQGFPVILAYYFINSIVWISDFKPLHLEGDVDVHKYYWLGTLQPGNSATQITLFVLSISEKYD